MTNISGYREYVFRVVKMNISRFWICCTENLEGISSILVGISSWRRFRSMSAIILHRSPLKTQEIHSAILLLRLCRVAGKQEKPIS